MSTTGNTAKLRRKKKKKKDQDAGDLPDGTRHTRSPASSGGDVSSSRKKPKKKADPREMSTNDIDNEVGGIEQNISKNTLLLPKDASLFAKAMYVLREALVRMSGGGGNEEGGEDDGDDDNTRKKKKDDDDARDGSPETADTRKKKEPTPQEARDIKEALAEYRRTAGALQDKMDQMPKVAGLPTDPAKMDQADIKAGIKDIDQDINKAVYFPPGIAGIFLKIAYALREALKKMDGQEGIVEGKTYRKLLDEYKEAYAKVKDYLDNAPDGTDSDADIEVDMTMDDVEKEMSDIRKRFARIAKLPGSEAREYLENTLSDVKGMLDDLKE